MTDKFDITAQEHSDSIVTDIEVNDDGTITYCLDFDCVIFNKNDAIALTKHFGLIDDK